MTSNKKYKISRKPKYDSEEPTKKSLREQIKKFNVWMNVHWELVSFILLIVIIIVVVVCITRYLYSM